MLEPPRIVQTVAQHIAVIHFHIAKDEIQEVMGPGLGELMTTISTQGLNPAGPWFDHY